MAATIYTRTYTYTGQANASFSGGVGTTKIVPRSKFAVTGNTTEIIGQIVKVEISHYHSATNSSGSRPREWALAAKMVCGSDEFDSDVVTEPITANIVQYVNTISAATPIPAQFDVWSEIQLVKANVVDGSDLYWRATKVEPITITVYFISARDTVDGNEDPPTVGDTIGTTDGRTISGGSTTMAYFGGIVQNQSDIILTGEYTIDRSYEYISATHTITITDANGNSLYEASQIDNNVFHVGAIRASGQISVTYTVTDNGGKSAEGLYTFNVLPYSAPAFSGDPSIERYEDNFGEHIASPDGVYLWLTLNAAVSQVNAQSANKNLWSLTCDYASEDGQSAGTITIYDMAAQGAATIYSLDLERDETAFGQTEFDASQGWTFVFTLTDLFGSVESAQISIDEAGAFFNVYPDGVSVGMRGNGTPDNKLFEVAPTHTSIFGGFARFDGGLSAYDYSGLAETAAGSGIYVQDIPHIGRWKNGKSVSRRIVYDTNSYASTSSWQSSGVALPAFDAILNVRGGMKFMNGNSVVLVGSAGWYQSSSYYASITLDSTGAPQYYVHGSSRSITDVITIIDYVPTSE